MSFARGFIIALLAATAACDAPFGDEFPPDRQKLLVSDEHYLTDEYCWGGVDLEKKGVWIPVEFAVDETEPFTKVGISSRTCELMTVVEFERDARKVPKHLPFEAHADRFEFVFSKKLEDSGQRFGSSKLFTTLSTSGGMRYSDAVVFFDGHMKLGPDFKMPAAGRPVYSVVEVKK